MLNKICTTYLESHEFSFPIQHFFFVPFDPKRILPDPTTRRVAVELAKEVRPHHADGGEHANPPSDKGAFDWRGCCGMIY